MAPEAVFDCNMIFIQRFMNDLHMEMRRLASLADQEIDENRWKA